MPGVGAKPKKDIHKFGTCDFIEAHRIAKSEWAGKRTAAQIFVLDE